MIAQLRLMLGDRRKAVPWNGRSPRDLTRIQIELSSQRERAGDDVPVSDPFQLSLFEEVAIEKRYPTYGGAPCLFGSFDDEEGF